MLKHILTGLVIALFFSSCAFAKATLETRVKVDENQIEGFSFYYPHYEELNGVDGEFEYLFVVEDDGTINKVKRIFGDYHYVIEKQVREFLSSTKLESNIGSIGRIRIKYSATDNLIVRAVIDEHGKLYKGKKYQDAKEALLLALDHEPQNPVLHYFLGNTYWRLGNEEDSIKAFKKALNLAPDNSLPYYSLAYRYYQLNDFSLARKYLSNSIALNNVWENHWLGFKINESEGNVEKALSHLSSALELTKNKARIYEDRAWYLYELESFKPALDDFQAALEYKPLNSNLLKGATKTAIELGETILARRYIEKALENHPDNTDTLFWVSFAYDNLGEDKLAVKYLTKLIDIDEAYDSALNNLGFSYTKLGNYNAAIKALEKGVSLKIKSEYIYNNLGVAYFHNGEYQRAIEVLSFQVEQDKKANEEPSAFTMSYLAWSYIKLDEPDRALSLIEDIIDNDTSYYDGLYNDLYGEGNFLPYIVEDYIMSFGVHNLERDMVDKLNELRGVLSAGGGGAL